MRAHGRGRRATEAPGAGLADFLAAGAAALRHPEPAPVEAQRRLELITSFARGRPPPFRRLATLRGDPLERWLRYAFGDPERFADEILLERMSAERPGSPAHEIVAALRFLRDARVPAGAIEHAELAVDRRVLLEQASPWRYFSGDLLAPAVQAVRAWQRRYRLAYERHYRAMVERASEVAQQLRAAMPAAEAVRRFDRIEALGPPLGAEAAAALDAAVTTLTALPRDPDPQQPRTAGVTLGVEPPLCGEACAAVAAVRSALETQRRRLASETMRAVLARPGVPDLDRLLQTIAASDLDGIERVLTEDLTAHIERLLREARESPLAALALRVPRVTAESLDEAVLAFRAILEAALVDATNGTVVLREDRA